MLRLIRLADLTELFLSGLAFDSQNFRRDNAEGDAAVIADLVLQMLLVKLVHFTIAGVLSEDGLWSGATTATTSECTACRECKSTRRTTLGLKAIAVCVLRQSLLFVMIMAGAFVNLELIWLKVELFGGSFLGIKASTL